MSKLLRVMVPVFLLALCFKVDAQVMGSLGDVQMDEREFYTMTKQMGQFIHRFNYEEDPTGKRLYANDKDYRKAEKRKDALPLLFDLDNPRTAGNLRNFFVEDLLKNHQYLEFLGGNWFSAGGWTLTLTAKGDNAGWEGPIATEIASVKEANHMADGIYTLTGVKSARLQRGVNIIISGGKAQKVLVK